MNSKRIHSCLQVFTLIQGVSQDSADAHTRARARAHTLTSQEDTSKEVSEVYVSPEEG